MITPDDNAGFIQQLLFCQKRFILGFLQPVGMIAMIPEQRFMTDDQIGTARIGLADNINRSVTRRYDACTFLIRIPIENLVAGRRVVDRLPWAIPR